MADFQLRPVDIRTVTDRDLPTRLAFAEVGRQERRPDDPPVTAEDYRARIASIPDHVQLQAWEVRETADGPIIASGSVGFQLEGSNQHLANIYIDVHPEYRQRGIARRLLGNIVNATEAAGRKMLNAEATNRVPASTAFLERIGGEAGLVSRTSQLRLSEVAPSLLEEWIATAPVNDFDLLRFDTPVEPEGLDEAAELANRISNDVPRGDLDMKPFHITPEMILAMDRQLHATGGKNWVLVARDRSNGKYAGLTMLSWRPQSDYMVNQGITGVLPEYRRRGLGRWLKAELLKWVLEQHPEVKVARTNNAESNSAMLGINIALGFQPYSQETVYQLPLDRAKAYLESARTDA